MALASLPVAVTSGGGGVGETVCVNLFLLLALTITPIETLIDAFRVALPGEK